MRMKRFLIGLAGCIMGIGMLMLPLSASAAEQKEKVILDTDMVEMFDDGVALRMLAKSPRVDLLGVICVTATAGCRKVLHIPFAKWNLPAFKMYL